jgi:hypothetical protein
MAVAEVVDLLSATTAGPMIRFLRCGAFSVWLAVVTVMVALAAWAAMVTPASEAEPQPAISEMFNDAVDLRHQLAVAVRSGDSTALANMAQYASAQWDGEVFNDWGPARHAAVSVLDRMAAVAGEAGPMDPPRRDRLTSEADLFAALASGYDNPAVVAAAENGVEVMPGRPVPDEAVVVEIDPRSRARQRLVAAGVDLAGLESKLSNAGAPVLDGGLIAAPELVAPSEP